MTRQRQTFIFVGRNTEKKVFERKKKKFNFLTEKRTERDMTENFLMALLSFKYQILSPSLAKTREKRFSNGIQILFYDPT